MCYTAWFTNSQVSQWNLNCTIMHILRNLYQYCWKSATIAACTETKKVNQKRFQKWTIKAVVTAGLFTATQLFIHSFGRNVARSLIFQWVFPTPVPSMDCKEQTKHILTCHNNNHIARWQAYNQVSLTESCVDAC